MSKGDAWTREEVEAIVADYLHMLTLQLSGQAYSKTQHRRALAQKLSGRSDGSIERKHQNISSILIELSSPWIVGYKPLGNYQDLLFDVVADRAARDQLFIEAARSAVEQPATSPLVEDYANVVTNAPPYSSTTSEPAPARYKPRGIGIFRNYLALEASNRSLGRAGEDFVVAYEHHRLHSNGLKVLADRVEHVSATKGDGLGYDVLSFDLDGRERLIEVKTTAFGKETPFYVSRAEVEVSKQEAESFHLYRLFEFRRQPKFFDLQGEISANCRLDPMNYVARFT